VNYFRNGRGRAIGYVVQFADGHLASLSYGEIEQLQNELRPEPQSTVPATYNFADANAELFS
jgi:hypothetical protein